MQIADFPERETESGLFGERTTPEIGAASGAWARLRFLQYPPSEKGNDPRRRFSDEQLFVLKRSA
jgi:hypothetical protein